MKNTNNPDRPTANDLLFTLEETSTLSVIKDGLHHEVESLVKLELTAEQMLQEEARLVRDYVANDAKSFWDDLKGELLYWELTRL